MLVNESGDENTDVEQIEDKEDVRVTNENDATKNIENKPSCVDLSPLKKDNVNNSGHGFKKQLKTSMFNILSVNDETKKNKNKPSSRSPLKEETFYYIDNELKKQLKESSDFSLLKTFDATKSDVPNREICQKQSKFSNEPIKKTEEKSIPEKKENKDVPKCSELPQGLWHKEPLFFQPDDPRFEGAMKFVKYINPDYAKTFSNLRKQIKSVVRYKVQKVKQHADQRQGPKVDRRIKRKKFKANNKK